MNTLEKAQSRLVERFGNKGGKLLRYLDGVGWPRPFSKPSKAINGPFYFAMNWPLVGTASWSATVGVNLTDTALRTEFGGAATTVLANQANIVLFVRDWWWNLYDNGDVLTQANLQGMEVAGFLQATTDGVIRTYSVAERMRSRMQAGGVSTTVAATTVTRRNWGDSADVLRRPFQVDLRSDTLLWGQTGAVAITADVPGMLVLDGYAYDPNQYGVGKWYTQGAWSCESNNAPEYNRAMRSLGASLTGRITARQANR